MSSGTRTITSHDPWKKLLVPTTTATTAVVIAPRPLIEQARAASPASRRRHQRTSMPVWESVKAMNTPSV